MKRAFTFIELIFVIVIIGILASIAIPKLAATRDDALAVREISNIKQCVKDIGSGYIATGIENNNTASCSLLKCATIDVNNSYDGKFTLKINNNDYYCDYVKNEVERLNIQKEYNFGGRLVRY